MFIQAMPIALSSHINKLFEKILRKYIVKYLEDNSLINLRQHGFRAGKSCLSQLPKHYNTTLQMLESGKNKDVIYLDFAKAIDKVDFAIA